MLTNSYNILGIDPGNNLGISCFTIDSTTNDIIAINTELMVLSSMLQKEEHRIDKFILLQKIIGNLSTTYRPVADGIESAFMNTKFANAVMQLSQYVSMIEYRLYKDNPYIKILKYPPKYVKSKIYKGTADKQDMLCAIRNIPEIISLLDITNISDHQVDATAICYTLLQDIKQYPMILYSIM